jgi:hypothetical protein
MHAMADDDAKEIVVLSQAHNIATRSYTTSTLTTRRSTWYDDA